MINSVFPSYLLLIYLKNWYHFTVYAFITKIFNKSLIKSLHLLISIKKNLLNRTFSKKNTKKQNENY